MIVIVYSWTIKFDYCYYSYHYYEGCKLFESVQ